MKKLDACVVLVSVFCCDGLSRLAAQSTYQYFRLGNSRDMVAVPAPGFALMGGGEDLDPAFAWLGQRAGGGDFLILRARGDDAYNAYVQKLAPVNSVTTLNSVATLVIPSREAAADPFVARTIANAEAIFIAGGDQARYINFWKGTPVQAALNDALHRGVPIGGTSAGLAVMGEYIYSAQNDKPDGPNLASPVALANPFNPQVVIVQGFLDIPLLANTITDTHFSIRDRVGRLLAFMARIVAMNAPRPSVRAIAIDQSTAVLLDVSGKATVVGTGAAYFLRAGRQGAPLKAGQPLTFGPVEAQKVRAGDSFDVANWKSSTPIYAYTVDKGVVHSSLSGGQIY